MTQEALKLALEALDGVLDDAPKVLDASISGGLYEVVQCREAITAIKEALAQEQEPVAWLSTDSIGERHLCFDKPLDNDPVQPLYTTPPQRTWVGLTDEEENEYNYLGPDMHWVIQEIAAKLKEKNT